MMTINIMMRKMTINDHNDDDQMIDDDYCNDDNYDDDN